MILETAGGNPFPGLRAFEPEEDHLFFGRDRPADELLIRLRTSRFIAVVGGSGSGKSSLVKSGAIPSLYRGYMVTAGSSWRVAITRPGENPIRNLAKALADVLYSDEGGDLPRAAMTEAALRANSGGLVDAVEQARLGTNSNVLVLVDQFEELFRFEQSRQADNAREDALTFVNLLLQAAAQKSVPVFICLTMRSEYLGECADYPGLPEAVNQGQFLVPRMTRDELRAAITGPVAVGGARISPGLVTRLLNDSGEAADQLPVLQHALMRTWNHWTARTGGSGELEIEDYEAIGALEAALDRHAEEALEEIPAGAPRDLAKRVFQALTEKGADERGVRRPTRLGELARIAGVTSSSVAAVVEPFRQAGRTLLVPPPGAELTEDSIIDLSHEALMRVWKRLANWAAEEARSAVVYRRLVQAAELRAAGKTSLWRNPELGIGLQWRAENQPSESWAARYGGGFREAMNFLNRSRRSNLVRTVGLIGSVLAVLITAAGWWVHSVEAEKAKLEVELAEFLEKNPKFKQEARELRETNRDLSLKYLAAKDENTNLTAEHERLSREYDEVERRTASYRRQIQEISDSIGSAEQETAGLSDEVTRLESERQLENDKLDKVRSENQVLRARAMETGVLAIERRQLASAARDSIVAMSPEMAMASLISALAKAPSPDALMQEVDLLRSENLRLTLTIDELRQANAKLTGELEPVERENARLRAAIEAQRKALAELDQEVTRLEEEYHSLETKHRTVLAENSRLKQQRDLIARDVRNIEKLINDLNSENELLTKLLSSPPSSWRQLREFSDQLLIFRGRER